MKANKLKIETHYLYMKDGGKQAIIYLGMEEDKYKFAPITADGMQFGQVGKLTEHEVSKYVQA